MTAPGSHDDGSLSMSPGQYGGPPGGGGFTPPPGGFGAPPGGYGPPGAPPPGGYGPPGFGPHGPQPPFGGGFAGNDRSYAEGKVKAPAITMMALVGLGALLQIASVVMNVVGTGAAASNASSDDRMAALSSGAVGIAIGAVSIVSSVFSFYGLLKMIRLQSRTLVYVAVIASMLPLVGSCWCVNLFVGIWALVTLSDETVKRSFT